MSILSDSKKYNLEEMCERAAKDWANRGGGDKVVIFRFDDEEEGLFVHNYMKNYPHIQTVVVVLPKVDCV